MAIYTKTPKTYDELIGLLESGNLDFPKDWKKDPMWRRKKIFGII